MRKPSESCGRSLARLLGSLTSALCVASCGPAEAPSSGPSCITVATRAKISVTSIDRSDLLFVVDDSPSMVEEQATLRRELPRLLDDLVGERADDVFGHPVQQDVHVGVVSADLGTLGLADAEPGCSAWGDDGLLQHAPLGEGCRDEYPAFLSYAERPSYVAPLPGQTPAELAHDVGCIALSGTSGCGYAQPLEAALKALWPPAWSPSMATGAVPLADRVTFFGEPLTTGSRGHGDRAHAGFLRSDPLRGLSLLGIVIVTDKDDCSLLNRDLLTGAEGQTPALRCAEAPASLRDLERYRAAYQALRAGNEQLVVLSVIAGVPPDVSAELYTPNGPYQGFAEDPGVRDRFYERVLTDPRMQLTPRADGTLEPSCSTPEAQATPPRRLVELASRFGANGVVTSICDSDWSSALDPWRQGFGHHRGGICLPRSLPRSERGLVDCEMIWELPPPETAEPTSFTACDEAPALLATDTRQPRGETGGERCVVRQLAVTGDPAAPTLEQGFGWYYDDFSFEVRAECTSTPKQRITFAENALPPTGATASIECVRTHVRVPATDELLEDAEQPELHAACDPSDPNVCARVLRDALGGPLGDGLERTLQCHGELQQCVPPCPNGACPKAWSCTNDAEPYCVPGVCGA